MKRQYNILGGAATVFALCLLAVQIHAGLEYTAGETTAVRNGIIAAMVTVAFLPIFVELAKLVSKFVRFVLVLGLFALLAYSLPATIGRVGETKEVKALGATDAVTLTAEVASIKKTLLYAAPQMEKECLGSPDPLPPKGWPECRRTRGTVKALMTERDRIEKQLREMGNARLGDTSSKTVAWALSPLGLSETAIRNGTGIAYGVGLEIVISALFSLAVASFRIAAGATVTNAPVVSSLPRGGRSMPAPLPTPAPTAPAPALEPATPRAGKKTRDEALADLRLLLKAGQVPGSQQELVERWGLDAKSTVSKWFAHWEAHGQVPLRVSEGRCKTVAAD